MYRPDTSPDSGVAPSSEGPSPLDRVFGATVGASVYDAILLGIPVLFFGGVLGGWAAGASTPLSVSVGGLAALTLVAYALFGTPPDGLEN